jgi:hypothetical protein
LSIDIDIKVCKIRTKGGYKKLEKNTVSNNESSFYLVLETAMKIPGVRIDRAEFLRRELTNHFKPEIVDLAIEKNPAFAGITVSQIEMIARSSINYETGITTATSAAAGIPGGFAMLGTVPADITQYFAHLIRVLQKLAFLYGWKDFYNSKGEFDDETSNKITLFMGVMFGVGAANVVVAKIAKQAAIGVEKKLVSASLTKGLVYPIVKKVAGILGSKMTKEIFAKSVSKIVPVIGAVISGGFTYFTFLPNSNNLKKYLRNLPIADVEFYKTEHDDIDENEIFEVDDIEIE